MTRCLRIDFRRLITRYLDGSIPTETVRRFETHLVQCEGCRLQLAHVQTGERLARQAPFFTPHRDPWAAIELVIAEPAQTFPSQRYAYRSAGRWDVPRPARLLSLVLAFAVAGGLLISLAKRDSPQRSGRVQLVTPSIDPGEFHKVTISSFEKNTAPHVVVEGYVSEVRYNSEEDDLSFKLVEIVTQQAPFVICEIVKPMNLELPQVGSRVRVYGVSRFDAQPDRHWHEVHPVMKIEVLSK